MDGQTDRQTDRHHDSISLLSTLQTLEQPFRNARAVLRIPQILVKNNALKGKGKKR
jgi:hypothetical protein